MSTQQKNVPALRFSEFSGEWEEKKLSENINLISGQHLNPDEYNNNTLGIPYFTGPSDFTNEELSVSKWTVKNGKKAHAGDILITVKGSGVGAMIMLGLPEVVMGRQLMAIKGKNSDAAFIYQHLTTKLKYFQSLGMGNMIPGISREDIQLTKMFFPTLPEQQKIASFLTAIDTKIELLTKKKSLLEQYKKGIMQQLFSQKLRFKDEEGNEFPEWKENTLGELVSFHSTNSFSRELLTYTIGTIKNIHYGDIHTKFNTQFDITKEIVPYIKQSVDLRKIPKESYCQKGDLIIADASEDYKDIGKSIEIINIANQKLLAGLHTYIARDKMKIALGFKGYLMQTTQVRKQIMRLATGVSVLSISKNKLAIIKISVPSLPEQQKIVTFLSAIDVKVNSINQKISKIRTFKKGLQQQLFV